MSQLKQLKFQEVAALQIAERFDLFLSHPKRRRRPTTGAPAPFVQTLAAITSAGKTPIMALAISHMRSRTGSAAEPIIFWMSKSKSVVAQTHGNFSVGGKYSELISSFELLRLKDVSAAIIRDASKALIITTTTGLFNNKEGADGSRKVYEASLDDFGGKSLWDHLVARETDAGRRPLIVVYDEAHNISDQQSDILEELEPDAYILASATHRLPPNFIRDVLTPVHDWAVANYLPLKAKFLVTEVDPRDVVEQQLVKRCIDFEGSTAPMETSIDNLFVAMEFTEKEAALLNIRPKAIYVCNTNVTEDGTPDNPDLPFDQRKAPPIRIWNYLVKDKRVNPRDIAVYSSELILKPGKTPTVFNIFRSSDDDFDTFREGNFKHIIFNQSLKEGWDDAECYFAYIDKGLGSKVDIEQIVGRLLRQPNVTHYPHPCLNTAGIYLRVDSKNVFSQTVDEINARLNSTGAKIDIKTNFSNGAGDYDSPVLCSPREQPKLGRVSIHAGESFSPIERILEKIVPFDEGSRAAQGAAEATKRTLQVGTNTATSVAWRREAVPTRQVRLRWLLYSKLRLTCPRAADAVCLEDAKYDSKLFIGSQADRGLDELVTEIGEAYYRYSDLVYLSKDSFVFPVVRVRPSAREFTHSLYPQYGAMNMEEAPFAEALERREYLWHRNPSNEGAGYAIPLLDGGDTRNFFPDFLVWTPDGVFCLDTKGKHLLQEAVQRKLFNISERNVLRLRVRFIVKGKQEEPNGPLRDKAGFTVWRFKGNAPLPVHCADIDEAVAEALRA